MHQYMPLKPASHCLLTEGFLFVLIHDNSNIIRELIVYFSVSSITCYLAVIESYSVLSFFVQNYRHSLFPQKDYCLREEKPYLTHDLNDQEENDWFNF